MKPALYYAIRIDYLQTIVAVTSEKPTRHGGYRWFGRNLEYDETTHGTSDQLRGKFKTQAKAEAMRETVAGIVTAYTEQAEPHLRAIQQLKTDERNAITAAIAMGSDA